MKGIMKYQSSRFLIIGGTCCVVGLWLAFFGFRDWIGLSGKLTDFNQMEASEVVEGKYVEGEVLNSYGCYYEEQVKSLTGRAKEKKRIYLMIVGKNKDTVLGVMVNQTQFYEFDKLTALSGVGEPSVYDKVGMGSVKGRIYKCNSRMQEFLNNNLDRLGDCMIPREKFLPYYIDGSDSSGGTVSGGFGIIVTAVGLFVILFLFIPKYKNEKYSEISRSDSGMGTIVYSAKESVAQPKRDDKMSVFADEEWEEFMRQKEEEDKS